MSYVAWAIFGLFGGWFVSGLIVVLLFLVGVERSDGVYGLLTASMVTAGVLGGLFVARERRRPDGRGELAYSRVVGGLGAAVVGAWIGSTAALLTVNVFGSIDSPSAMSSAVRLGLMLSGAAVGVSMARLRRN